MARQSVEEYGRITGLVILFAGQRFPVSKEGGTGGPSDLCTSSLGSRNQRSYLITGMKLPLPMGALREMYCNGSTETGIDPATLATNFRVFPDTCLNECEDNINGFDVESDPNSAIIGAVKVLLQGLGEDVHRDGLRKTPLRVAKAFREGTRGYYQTAKDVIGGAIFPEAGVESGIGCGGGSGGLVVVRNIDLFSYCEACLLPFRARCHIAYISSGHRVVGLSKLSRVVEVFAKRLQAPQRLANEACKALYDTIRPLGVAIALECWHMQFQGVEGYAYQSNFSNEEMQGWVRTSVYAGSGLFEVKNNDVWSEFIALLSLGGVNVQRSDLTASVVQQGSWCPFQAADDLLSPTIDDRIAAQHDLRCNGHRPKIFLNTNSPPTLKLQPTFAVSQSVMITAVETILSALGEDPTREELRVTPLRFVQWLANFHQTTTALHGMGSQKWGSSPFTNATLSSMDTTCGGVLFEMNAQFYSQCEHHLLPFFGVAHIGYFSVKENDQLDRSKINAIVQFFSRKLQVQERLTKQIAEAIASSCNAVGVMVVLEASHICMISRGIEKIGSSTVTIAVLGCFVSDSAAKAAFLQKISGRAVERR